MNVANRSFLKIFILLILNSSMFCVTYAQTWKDYSDSAVKAEEKRQFNDAVFYYKKAQQSLPSDSAETFTTVGFNKKIGESYLRLSNFDSAFNYLKSAENLLIKNNSTQHNLYASVCDLLGRVYENIQPRLAESYYLKAQSTWKYLKTANSREYAAATVNLGNYNYNAGDYKKAESLYLEGKTIQAELLEPNSSEYARTCNNLSALYLATGALEKAEPLMLEAKRIRALLAPEGQNFLYAITLTNLGNLYTSLSQFEKATSCYLQAKDIRAKQEPILQHADYAASCNILADLYAATSKYKEAEDLYLEAMKIRKNNQGAFSEVYAESCNNLATLYASENKFEVAEKFALQAKIIWDSLATAQSPDFAISSNNLGNIYLRWGKYDTALNYFLQARNIWKEQLGENHPFYNVNTKNIARVYSATNKTEAANSLYKHVLNAENKQIQQVFRFTSEKEKMAYLQNGDHAIDEYVSFYMKHEKLNNAGDLYNYQLTKRNMVLSSMLLLKGNIENSGDTLLENKYQHWLELKRNLAQYYSGAFESSATETNKLEIEINELEKWLTSKSASFKNTTTTINWKNIQQNLNKGEAAIEFISFNYFDGFRQTDSIYYAALVLRKDLPAPIFVLLFEQKKLDSLYGKNGGLAQINNLYTRGVKGIKVLRNTEPLYNIIWKTAEPSLANIKKIYYSPAADLHKISFAAIINNEKKLLSDEYELVQLSTTANIINATVGALKMKDRISLYGGINYDPDSLAISKSIAAADKRKLKKDENYASIFKGFGKFIYLPGTLKEVSAINKMALLKKYKTNYKTGEQAIEEKFQEEQENKSPEVLHIATHGFFNKENLASSKNVLLNSGLLFAGAQYSFDGKKLPGVNDGIATALDISTMQLTNTKLTVLSACETALGEIKGEEGVFGLQRAFKLAGTQYILMSLWQVPDNETAEFMQLFYAQLFSKQSIADSFLTTQNKMKIKYSRYPERWAAWILVR